MKLFSKMLAVVLTTVGGVGTLGGVIMFAVGGSPTVKQTDINTNETIVVGIGMLNYDKAKNNNLSFSEFLKYTVDNREQFKAQINSADEQIKISEQAIKGGEEAITAIQTAIKTITGKLQEDLAKLNPTDANYQTQAQALITAATTQANTLGSQITTLTQQVEEAKNRLNSIKGSISTYEGYINAQTMNDLTVAGAVIMSIGIVAAALSAWASIKVENSEERKIAKKNKTTV